MQKRISVGRRGAISLTMIVVGILIISVIMAINFFMKGKSDQDTTTSENDDVINMQDIGNAPGNDSVPNMPNDIGVGGVGSLDVPIVGGGDSEIPDMPTAPGGNDMNADAPAPPPGGDTNGGDFPVAPAGDAGGSAGNDVPPAL